jgi:hypothetical protein
VVVEHAPAHRTHDQVGRLQRPQITLRLEDARAKQLHEVGVAVGQVADRRDQFRIGLHRLVGLRLRRQRLGIRALEAAERLSYVESRQKRRGRPGLAYLVQLVDAPRRNGHDAQPRPARELGVQPLGQLRLGARDVNQDFGLIAEEQQLPAGVAHSPAQGRQERQQVLIPRDLRRETELANQVEPFLQRIGQVGAQAGERVAALHVPEDGQIAVALRAGKGDGFQLAQERGLADAPVADDPVGARFTVQQRINQALAAIVLAPRHVGPGDVWIAHDDYSFGVRMPSTTASAACTSARVMRVRPSFSIWFTASNAYCWSR